MMVIAKLFKTTFITALLLGFSSVGHADTTANYTPPFRIATADFPPFSYVDENGRPAGVMSEVLEVVLQELAKDGKSPKLDHIPIDFFPWQRAYKMASEGKNVLIYPLGISGEREKLFYWIGPEMERNIWVYALKDKHQHMLTAKDLKGALVGVTRGYSWSNDLKDIGAIPDESRDDKILILKIADRRMSYISMDEALLAYQLQEMRKQHPQIRKVEFSKVYPLNVGSKRSFGFSKNSDPDLLARFRAAYEKVGKRGLIRKILEKHKIH